MTITDEMVEKALHGYFNVGYDQSGNENHFVHSQHSPRANMRLAIEAVAPMLIAAYLRKEAEPMGDLSLAKVFLTRAQELDPK